MSIEPIAVLVSDIHLSHRPPPCWNTEKVDWYDAMEGYLNQLDSLAYEYNIPIICGGDVFDKWNSPPELIEFALKNLPEMYSVPGQHDLPNHNYNEMNRSAYGVLVAAGRIHNLDPDAPTVLKDLDIYASPWEHEIIPPSKKTSRIQLLVAHRYLWKVGKGYPGAPERNKVGALKKELSQFDAALFGDNHVHFTAKAGRCNVLNNGGFMVRKSDEIGKTPSVGILYSDGSIGIEKLDTSEDEYVVTETVEVKRNEQLQDFLKDLSSLGEGELNFKETVVQFMDTFGTDTEVKQIVLESIENES